MSNIDKACEQAMQNLKRFIQGRVMEHKMEVHVQFQYLRMPPDERKEWCTPRFQEVWNSDSAGNPWMRRAMAVVIAETGGAA